MTYSIGDRVTLRHSDGTERGEVLAVATEFGGTRLEIRVQWSDGGRPGWYHESELSHIMTSGQGVTR